MQQTRTTPTPAALALAVAALAAAAIPAAAQAVHRPSPLEIERRWLAPGPDTLVMRVESEGGPARSIRQIESLQVLESADRSFLVQVTEVQTPAGPMTDTTAYRLSDLAPTVHVSHGPGGDLRLRYEAGEVTGRRGTGDDARPIAVALGAPLFDPGALTLLLRFAPLSAGYHVRAPYLDHTTLEEAWAEIEVTGREAVELSDGSREDAWVVRMTVDRGRSADHWVGVETRRVLRMEAEMAPGVRIVIRR